MTTKCFLIVCFVIAAIAIYFPARHARHYDYIKIEDVVGELVLDIYDRNESNLKNCSYLEKVLGSEEIEINSISSPRDFKSPLQGGVYHPEECKPLVKVALIIPYRNRTQQLDTFLVYIHNFLQNQQISYRILIVNQNDSLPFNRAKMLNYGAKFAIDHKYPCLILHDIDLIPLSTGNIYGCGRKPRHMSSSLDTFRFNLPYLTLFGGAVAIQAEHFQRINGMSNQFHGWGGEDDDFYKRLEAHNLLPYRFAPSLSKYTMLFHKKEQANRERFKNLEFTVERHRMDGLSTLSTNYSVILKDLYTLINVS